MENDISLCSKSWKRLNERGNMTLLEKSAYFKCDNLKTQMQVIVYFQYLT